MRTAIYNKVMRMAALLCVSGTMTTNALAQEYLHLFYKNGNREAIEIKEDTRIEFVKQTQLNAYWHTDSGNDTIHLSASSGRSQELGFVESNADWTITTDSEWLLARKGNSPMEKGNGIAQDYFVVYPTANESDSRRYGKVTVKSIDGEQGKEFVVVQHPYMLTLSYEHFYGNYEVPVISRSVTLAWNDTAYYAVAYPNHGVKVLSYPNWMEMDFQSNGDDYCKFEDIMKEESAQSAGTAQETYVRFRFSQNNAPEDRTGNIIFEGHGQTAVLTVTQQGLNEKVIVGNATALAKMLYQYGAGGMSDRHSDYGYPSLMLAMESRGADLVSESSGYNWYNDQMKYEDMQSNYYYTYMHWNTMYNHIMAANKVWQDFGERAGESLFQFYLGQASALRAFNYFYLAQLYQQTYVGNEDQPCVPIIAGVDAYTVAQEQRPRATVREVYDYILQDLDLAEHLLSQTTVARSGKHLVTPQVIWGLRARIYMVMNEWEKAADNAQRLIAAGVATPYTRDEVSRPTFADINHDAWLWGIDTEETDRVVTSGIVNWPSHMGSLNYGYASVGAWRMVSQSLYNAIPSTDVRKGWFLDANGTSANLNDEQQNHVVQYGMPAYTQVKFAPYKDEIYTSTNANDIPLMRIEEMYLILAEAKAMMGDTGGALNTLNSFVTTYRDPAYNCTATNTEDICEAVWMQRRIELWGEGHSYFDLMRMKKGVDRRGAGFPTAYVYNIPAGDAALIYPIPDREMNNNPSLTQNPVATQPQPVEE